MVENGFEVLVVEDEASLRALIEIAMNMRGCKMVGCSNGVEAIALSLDPSHQFGAVLMDIKMPLMDGLEATRRLRAHPKTKDIPIIIVSALAWPSDLEEGMQAGADAYLIKPYCVKKLFEILDRHRTKATS